MPNAHGTPIWYERLSDDADATQAFYAKALPWTVRRADPGGMDYRMIDAGEEDFVGGLMQLTPEMRSGGTTPAWLFYVGVDDVDAAVAAIVAAGGASHMPAVDMAGVGRIAMVADPQGIPFYVMRGASDEASTAFDRTGMGKANWNELATPDPAAAQAFYAEVFGWTYPDRMAMPGEMGDYVFIEAAGETIGALMKATGGAPPGWQFYFRAPDIEAARAAVTAHGGTVVQGPMEVPGGDMVMNAVDPQGVAFGIAAPGAGAGAA